MAWRGGVGTPGLRPGEFIAWRWLPQQPGVTPGVTQAGASRDTDGGCWTPPRCLAGCRAGLWAGLDAAVQGYPFEAWGLAGPELLGLSAGALEALGVRRLGHQELLLEAVEQLRALVSAGTHRCYWAHGAEGGDGWRWVTGGHPGLGGDG